MRDTSMCGCLSRALAGDLVRNPGMCPDWELNWRPFGSWAGTQSTEPHQAGVQSYLMPGRGWSGTTLNKVCQATFDLS